MDVLRIDIKAVVIFSLFLLTGCYGTTTSSERLAKENYQWKPTIMSAGNIIWNNDENYQIYKDVNILIQQKIEGKNNSDSNNTLIFYKHDPDIKLVVSNEKPSINETVYVDIFVMYQDYHKYSIIIMPADPGISVIGQSKFEGAGSRHFKTAFKSATSGLGGIKLLINKESHK